MTREEAIEVIKLALAQVEWDYPMDYAVAFDMAIKALEQEPCEDAISRQEVLYLIADYDLSMGQVVRGIHALPSVTPLSSGLEKNSQKLEKDFGELDCISRADAIRVASGYCHPSNVAKELAKLPSVTPIRPKGHWIEEFNDIEGEVRFTCSSCGKYQLFGTDFCYNCGSDNREVEE